MLEKKRADCQRIKRIERIFRNMLNPLIFFQTTKMWVELDQDTAACYNHPRGDE